MVAARVAYCRGRTQLQRGASRRGCWHRLWQVKLYLNVSALEGWPILPCLMDTVFRWFPLTLTQSLFPNPVFETNVPNPVFETNGEMSDMALGIKKSAVSVWSSPPTLKCPYMLSASKLQACQVGQSQQRARCLIWRCHQDAGLSGWSIPITAEMSDMSLGVKI